MTIRGMGRVFRPSYTDKKTGTLKTSGVWWIEFSHNGREQRESSKSRNEADAKKLLKRRLGESGTGKLLTSDVAKTTFDDLKKIITDDYANNERESADQLKIVLKRLDEGFTGMKATDITAHRVSAYQAEQKKVRLRERYHQSGHGRAQAHVQARPTSRRRGEHAAHPDAARGQRQKRILRTGRIQATAGASPGRPQAAVSRRLHYRLAGEVGTAHARMAPCGLRSRQTSHRPRRGQEQGGP